MREAGLALTLCLIGAAAHAGCPRDASEPFTLEISAEGIAETVYPAGDGHTHHRVQHPGGIDELIYRGGYFMVEERGTLTSYTVDYEGDLDAVLAMVVGTSHRITSHETRSGRTTTAEDVHEVTGFTTLRIGDCVYEAVTVDSRGKTETRTLPRVVSFYLVDLTIVARREIYLNPEAQAPTVVLTYDRITDDPALRVPR
jgi:hypothetical protein